MPMRISSSRVLPLVLTGNLWLPSLVLVVVVVVGHKQPIRHAFDVPLPLGVNQSIRVNFRYNGSPSNCSNGNGSYDDYDNLILIFAVTVKADPNAPPSHQVDLRQLQFIRRRRRSLEAPKCSYSCAYGSGSGSAIKLRIFDEA